MNANPQIVSGGDGKTPPTVVLSQYLEAPAGFEPAIMVLQTIALATWLWSRLFFRVKYYIKYRP